MSDTNFDALRQLLGCYFHQDWPDEFDSDVAVAEAMVANEPADLIAKGIVEKLLSVEDIRAGLDRQFLPLEPMIVGLRLIERSTTAGAIERAEKAVAVPFPEDFRNLATRFDFGHLTIGSIVFGTNGDYPAEIVELNQETGWWGYGQRPNNRLMIANSDPFAILLETGSGFVYALDPDLGPQSSRKIADSFTSFFRGVGTIFLMRQQLEDRYGLATAVSTKVGSEHAGFWCQLAK